MKTRSTSLLKSLLGTLLLILTTTLITSPLMAEEWGTRPYETEKPLYDKQVKKLQREIRKAEHRKEQSHSRITITLGDPSGEDYLEFEKWYNSKKGQRPPELRWQLDEAKTNYKDAQKSFLIYAESNGPGPNHPTFGSNVRDSLWPAHLKMLSTQSIYYSLQATDEQFRLMAAERYSFSLFTQLYENAITGMQYVMRKHGEQFFGDLADCFGRAIIQGVGDQLLVGYANRGINKYPKWLSLQQMPGFKKESIINNDGVAVSCIMDTVRNSVVNATTSGIRFNFVSKVHNTWHIPEPVAEYWWSKMINPGDSAESPWDPQYRSMYDRVTQGAMNAIKRAADKKNIVEHSKDFVKFQWEQQIRKRIAKGARQSALDWMKKARKEQGKTLTRSEVSRHATRIANHKGRKVVEADTHVKWLKAADYAIMAVETSWAAYYLNSKKAEFEGAAKPIIDEYKRIVSCLQKSDMSTSPQAVIAIYELPKKSDVAEFFARCEGETPEQRLDRGQEVSRQLYLILEEARRIHSAAYPLCEAALNGAGGAPETSTDIPTENLPSPEELASRLEAFSVKAETIKTNAKEGFEKGTRVAKAKVAAEQAALQVCEKAGHSPAGLDTTEGESGIRNAANAFEHALTQSTTSADNLKAIEELLQTTRILNDELSVEAQALGVIIPEGTTAVSSNTVTTPAEVTEKLAASREAGQGLSRLPVKAEAVYDKLVDLVQKIEIATADRMLDEGLTWTTEIRDLSEQLQACQDQAQAALDGMDPETATADVANDQNSLPAVDINTLTAEAAAAHQELTNTLDLAKNYDEAAQTAANNADLCLNLLMMRGALRAAQGANGKASAACKAGEGMASKADAQLTQLQGEIETLTSEAKNTESALRKIESAADKAFSYANDAKRAATRARSDQTTADRLGTNACQRLRNIKTAQSIGEIQGILREIQAAVSSCKALAQKVRQSARDADGAASSCSSLETSLATMIPPAPLPPIDGKARNVKGQIDALEAVAGASEGQVAVISGAMGRASNLLVQGQNTASRIPPANRPQGAINEMGSIVAQIKGLHGEVAGCAAKLRKRSASLTSRQSAVLASEQSLSASIRDINRRLSAGGFTHRAQDATKEARNYAEIAGWSAEGMGEILVAVATCQAVAEKFLSEAYAAQAACEQRPRMKAIPKPSGSGWTCTCIDPKDRYDDQLGGCTANNCQALEQAFLGAVGNGQKERAGAILQQGGSCGFVDVGQAMLNTWNIGGVRNPPPPQRPQPPPPPSGGSTCQGSGGINLLCVESGPARRPSRR